VDVFGRERGLEELHPELFHAVRRNRDHEPIRLRGDGLCSGGTGGTLVEAQTPVNMYLFGFCLIASPPMRSGPAPGYPQDVGRLGMRENLWIAVDERPAGRQPRVIARPVACAPAPTRERGVTW